MSTHKRVLIITGGIVAFVALMVGVLVLVRVLTRPVVPMAIQKQLTATLILPAGNSAVVDKASPKYDAANKLLTFKATYKGANLVVTEQPSPSEFTDVPAAYDKFVADLGQYDQFDSALGTVYLALLPQQNGQQAAVMNAKGTLLFIKPSKQLSGTQWRQLFIDLDVVK